MLSTWSPATDVQETDTDLLVHVELPGLSKKDIKVNMDNGVLTIQGEKQHAAEEKENRYHVSERTYGRFTRSFTLPSEVDAEKINAGFENGVLTLTLPKVESDHVEGDRDRVIKRHRAHKKETDGKHCRSLFCALLAVSHQQ